MVRFSTIVVGIVVLGGGACGLAGPVCMAVEGAQPAAPERAQPTASEGAQRTALEGAQPAAPGGNPPALPEKDTARHVIYLHGRIVQEEQSARPRHPEYGHYELEEILAALRGRGFVVTGGIRPKAASVSESADRVVGQVRELLDSGVPADHVTVVGASMGASIAFLASVRLQNPDLRFAVLGACLSANVPALIEEEGKGPAGRLLAIRESSDELTAGCEPWKDGSDPRAPLRAREVVLDTGLSHGFIYKPLPEWVNPVTDHAKGENGSSS